MPTEKTVAELLQEELAALRESDEGRAARVRRIEALQLSFMDSALVALAHAAAAIPALNQASESLTDQRQAAVSNVVAHVDYAVNYLSQERERIQAQADEDAGGTEAPPE